MIKHTFYAPPEAIAGDTIVLPADEAYHAVRVLRMKSGEEAAVVDGAGNWYRIAVEVVGRKNMVGRILEKQLDVGEPDYQLTIGLGMLKSAARFENFIEKAVEFGVSRIIPLITKRTDRARLKDSRINKILITAMKQSGRCRKVLVDPPVKMRKFYKTLAESEGEYRGVCHETAPPTAALKLELSTAGMPRKSMILIGSEGGFTDDEIEALEERKFNQLSLGRRRLRAETAAMAVAAAYMLHSP
ncbi:MAG: 16S rRNA (uracil(1498)-N(3))-methyltransferase [Bacteroidetes bacterium]|nr:MAG: 16S rRNA (uracil(1498)-N(3))-methyltransferase [Bacteroidota bacterium]